MWSELLAAMRQTMRSAPGVGLAAPQIGLGIRVAVLEDPALVPEIAAERDRFPVGFRVLVNPSYESADAAGQMPTASFYEGCLSVPGYQAVVTRSASVRLRCSDENGHAVDDIVTGWAARIVAHRDRPSRRGAVPGPGVDQIPGDVGQHRRAVRRSADDRDPRRTGFLSPVSGSGTA